MDNVERIGELRLPKKAPVVREKGKRQKVDLGQGGGPDQGNCGGKEV